MSSTAPSCAPACDEASPKRRAVLDSAARLFMAEGFSAVSMDAVARAAQVSKATLYAHFPGKEALFAEIVGSNCQRMREEMAATAQAEAGHALGPALVVLGTHWLRFLLRPEVRALHRVVVAECIRAPELARAFYTAGPQALRRWLAGWLDEQAARGQLRPGTDTVLVADQFLALLRGDLFTRATLGLAESIAEAEIGAMAREAARAVLRLHGTPAALAAAESEGFA